LKSNHPGCGESARGKGYNANGVYCEGWAGQCGEEGVGATSWYLICETCRDKYMLAHNKKSINVNDSLLARATMQEPKFVQPSVTATVIQTTTANTATVNPSSTAFATKKSKMNSNMSMEFFDTMKNNALFLLDLNSHNGGLLNNKSAGNNLMPLKCKTAMRHSSASEFMAQPNTSNFSHRLSTNVVDENLRRASLQKQGSITNYFGKKLAANGAIETAPDLLWTPPESITCLEMLNAKLSESESCNVFSLDNEKNFYDPLVIAGHQQQSNQNGARGSNESKFHRSFSMIQGWGLYTNNAIEKDNSNHECIAGGNQVHQNNENRVVMRRKKTCLCDSSEFLLNYSQSFICRCSFNRFTSLLLFYTASEASLLNFPSKNLKKLVPDHILNPSFKGFSEVSSSHDIESEFLLVF
jgi:E3 ubiquitin-protein ligase MYCBP2